MKTKLFSITAFFLFFSLMSIAQTEKGSKLIGGNGYINKSLSRKSGDDQTFSISLNPNFGYFIGNNFCIGAKLPLSYSHYKNTSYNSPITKSSVLGIGLSPFVRYYMGKSKLRFFGEAKVGYSSSKVYYPEYKQDNYHYNNLSGSIGPGITYFMNEYIGLEGLVSLNYIESSTDNTYARQSNDNTYFNCVLGLQIYLPSKK